MAALITGVDGRPRDCHPDMARVVRAPLRLAAHPAIPDFFCGQACSARRWPCLASRLSSYRCRRRRECGWPDRPAPVLTGFCGHARVLHGEQRPGTRPGTGPGSFECFRSLSAGSSHSRRTSSGTSPAGSRPHALHSALLPVVVTKWDAAARRERHQPKADWQRIAIDVPSSSSRMRPNPSGRCSCGDTRQAQRRLALLASPSTRIP